MYHRMKLRIQRNPPQQGHCTDAGQRIVVLMEDRGLTPSEEATTSAFQVLPNRINRALRSGNL